MPSHMPMAVPDEQAASLMDRALHMPRPAVLRMKSSKLLLQLVRRCCHSAHRAVQMLGARI